MQIDKNRIKQHFEKTNDFIIDFIIDVCQNNLQELAKEIKSKKYDIEVDYVIEQIIDIVNPIIDDKMKGLHDYDKFRILLSILYLFGYYGYSIGLDYDCAADYTRHILNKLGGYRNIDNYEMENSDNSQNSIWSINYQCTEIKYKHYCITIINERANGIGANDEISYVVEIYVDYGYHHDQIFKYDY